MENIFVEFLPPWIETGIQPAFYDKESGTVLQQTARMYARVNMLIRMFNKLSKQTKTEITNFEESTTETVNEYIDKFNELHDYVHDYFDNLDVQEEINNKLDDMAEAGTLQEIITSYIQSNVAWTFDNVAEMKLATNLVNDSYAQTFGFYNLGDGGDAKYKIRTITPQDTVDETTIIALSDSTLVAELVPENDTIYTKQFGITGDGTTDETTKLQKFFAYDVKFYKVNSENILVDDDINLSSNSIIEFAKDCKITRKANALEWYFILNITNKENIEIHNAHIVGDKDEHTSADGQQGMGINISWSKNIYLKDCFVEKTWGDGYYIGESFFDEKIVESENNVLENCIASHCRRNGFALCGGKNHKLINCVSEYSDGHAPEAGLDIEPEGRGGVGAGLSDCEIVNFQSSHNIYGIQIHTEFAYCKNIFITGHQSNYDQHGIWYSQLDHNASVDYNNAIIRNTSDHAFVIWRTDLSVNPQLIIRDVIVDSCQNSGKRALYIEGTTDHTNGNITIDNFEVKNSSNTNDFSTLIYIVDTPNVTFQNILFKNIDRYNATSGIRKIYVKLASGDIKFENSHVQYDLSSGDLYLNTYYNEIYSLNSDATTNLYIQGTAPNGLYRYHFINNDDTISHKVIFSDGVKAYYGSTVISSGSYTTKTATGHCGHLDFYKQGDSIYIIDVSGYTL